MSIKYNIRERSLTVCAAMWDGVKIGSVKRGNRGMIDHVVKTVDMIDEYSMSKSHGKMFMKRNKREQRGPCGNAPIISTHEFES